MLSNDEYHELIEAAHNAMRDLLDHSAHDSGTNLRVAFGELREALEHRRRDERREREATVWRQTSMPVRESLLLQVLGDDSLILSELTVRMIDRLGYGTLHESVIRRLAMRMLRAGQLDRAPEKFQGKVRYRYFVNRVLDGPIVDLERAYGDDSEAVA